MTLDQLRYFQAVCRENNISRAAEHLNISQPSVSNAIAKLESEFGIQLLIRNGKRLILTKEGTVLSELTDDLFRHVDHIIRTMKMLSDSKGLNLGIPPMFSSLILPILYKDFFKDNSDFKINILEDDRTGLLRMLSDHTIDMAFLPHDGPLDPRFHSKLLIELDNVCCVNKSSPLSEKKFLRIEDLKNEPLVLFQNSFFQTERILERFQQFDCTPNILFCTSQVSTMQNIAAKGLAVGLMFRFLLDSIPELVGIPLNPPMRTQISLVWKKGEHLTGNMNRLIQFFNQKADLFFS